jgi:hypothetical protein
VRQIFDFNGSNSASVDMSGALYRMDFSGGSAGSSVVDETGRDALTITVITTDSMALQESMGVFAIADLAFEEDVLAFLERFREAAEISPAVDAVPFGAALVFLVAVFPAVLCSDAEDDVLFVVVGGFDFRVASEKTDERGAIEIHCLVLLRVICPRARYMLARRVRPRDPLPRRTRRFSGRGPTLVLGEESGTRRVRSKPLERELATAGRGCIERAALNVDDDNSREHLNSARFYWVRGQWKSPGNPKRHPGSHPV